MLEATREEGLERRVVVFGWLGLEAECTGSGFLDKSAA